MRARVNLYMQKFYVEPLLHAGMLHVERVRRETECKQGKTKLFSHPHSVELNNITLQESFFFMLWCLSDSIIHYLSVSEKVNEVVFFFIQESKAGGTPPQNRAMHHSCSNYHIVFTHCNRLY